MSLILSKWYERRAEIRREQHDKKVEIYQNLVDFWFNKILDGIIKKQPTSDSEVYEFMKNFTRTLIPWGSDDVVHAYVKYRSFSASGDAKNDSIEVMNLFEDLFYAMRLDLGHSNKGLSRGDLLRTFIIDYDKFFDEVNNN